MPSEVQSVSGGNKTAETSHMLSEKYQTSSIFQQVSSDIAELEPKCQALVRKAITNSLKIRGWKWIELCKRGFSNTFRDPGVLYYSYGISILVGVILGLIFINFGSGIGGIQNRVIIHVDIVVD
jgi:hypothetical protein